MSKAHIQGCRRRFAATCCALTVLQAASMLFADLAQAQTHACDLLKGVLAARIEATGVRGYTLEAVAAGTAVPPGARSIGTCEAGEYKILYRRWGATQPLSDAEGAVGPASAAQAAVVPQAQPRPSQAVQVDRASRPSLASAPSPAPRPAARSGAAASALAAPGHEPEKSPVASASEVEAVRAADRAVTQAAQVPVDENVVVKVPPGGQAFEFMAENWRWIWALVLLPVAGWIWVWRARRSAYDEAGLPRGPKL